MEDFQDGLHMIRNPGMILEECLESLALGSEEVQVRESRVVICKGDKVTTTSPRLS